MEKDSEGSGKSFRESMVPYKVKELEDVFEDPIFSTFGRRLLGSV